MSAEQLSLFPQKGVRGQYGPPITTTGPLSATSSLSAAIGGFHDHMIQRGFTENTIKAFLADLRILLKYLGANRAVSKISTEDLNDFLTYLLHRRKVPCKPKSYARRLTTLKVFFGWLAEEGIIASDPAAPLAHHPVSTPLPTILYDSQVEQLLATSQRLRQAEKPDTRPHLLISLLLQTGIKKGECMAIKLNDIDLSDPARPVLYIRYDNPKQHHKERKLKLGSDLVPVLRQYLAEYKPKERLFECTARNLEYVLRDTARLAGLETVSFETLRWTCAVRDYKAGMAANTQRKKLGLSQVRWVEAAAKLAKLAAPPL